MVATGCGDGQAGSGNKPGNTCRRGGPGSQDPRIHLQSAPKSRVFFGINWDLDGFGIIWNCSDPYSFSRLRGFVIRLSAVLNPTRIFKNLVSNSARLESTA